MGKRIKKEDLVSKINEEDSPIEAFTDAIEDLGDKFDANKSVKGGPDNNPDDITDKSVQNAGTNQQPTNTGLPIKPQNGANATSAYLSPNNNKDNQKNKDESVNPRMSKSKIVEKINNIKMGTDYKKLAEEAIARANGRTVPNLQSKTMNESRLDYGDIEERMPSNVEKQLLKRTHSLGAHPIFPDIEGKNFEEALVVERFKDVVTSVKRHFGTNEVDGDFLKLNVMGLVSDVMGMEKGNEKELVDLAIRLVVEEYDIPDGVINFDVKLGEFEFEAAETASKKEANIEFENHDEIELANKEVYKRRFINAMIQGGANKATHMFNLVDTELARINPQLPAEYGKVMSAGEYMYFTTDFSAGGGRRNGGMVSIDYSEEVPKIFVRATIFPLLIHELVKGVLEVLSTHGLPEDDRIQKFVLAKADALELEASDMRLGVPLWEKFTSLIPPADFSLKDQIYMELVSMPVDVFNHEMREIMAGTNDGKAIILRIIKIIKEEKRDEDLQQSLKDNKADHGSFPDELTDTDFKKWFD